MTIDAAVVDLHPSFQGFTLNDWLAYVESLHPSAIDMGLDRVRTVWQRMNVEMSAVVLTVGGTNGKGSTCAMLEHIFLAAGYRVGVYSSPHLVHFEERCRIQGQSVAAQDLVPCFAAVENARGETSLTYFEFTTLAILSCLATQHLDVLVLEVGLGGRLDAVNVVDADCAIVTSVDIDHTDYLGPDRESIGREKAGIFRADRPAIIADPMPPTSLVLAAADVGADVWRAGVDFQHTGDRQQWTWMGRQKRYGGLAYPALRGSNQLLNASGALAALEAIGHRLPVHAQAVRVGLSQVHVPGRFQMIPGQPVMVLDVAHNPHAAAALAHNLDQMGFYPQTYAVFGAMADKDVAGMVTPLRAQITHWMLCGLDTPRAATPVQLKAHLHAAGVSDACIQTCPDPVTGLNDALVQAKSGDRILVFGSFFTVGAVLAAGLPTLQAPHGVPASA